MKRFIVGSTVGMAALLLSAGSAFAHTEFQPSGANAGKTVSFKLFIEDEQSDAVTSKVELFLPADGSVTATEAPETDGMTVTIEATKSVTWTGNTKDGNLLLPVTLTMPAAAGRLQFKVLQTYDNNEVDRWIGTNPVGGPESESPGPVIDVVADGAAVPTTEAGGDHHGGSETTMDHGSETSMDHDGGGDHHGAEEPTTAAPTSTTSAPKKSDDSNSGAIIGIVLAVVVLGGGGAAIAMKARKKS